MHASATPDAWRPAGQTGRAVRSVGAALACTATAAVGHLTAGGGVPPEAVTACFVGAWVIAWLLAVRRITPGQLVGLLVLCQVGMHLAFSAESMSMTGAMLATHAVATAVSGWLLTRGEAFAWEIADRLGLRRHPIALFALPASSVLLSVRHHDVCRAEPLVYAQLERGPPTGR